MEESDLKRLTKAASNFRRISEMARNERESAKEEEKRLEEEKG